MKLNVAVDSPRMFFRCAAASALFNDMEYSTICRNDSSSNGRTERRFTTAHDERDCGDEFDTGIIGWFLHQKAFIRL